MYSTCNSHGADTWDELLTKEMELLGMKIVGYNARAEKIAKIDVELRSTHIPVHQLLNPQTFDRVLEWCLQIFELTHWCRNYWSTDGLSADNHVLDSARESDSSAPASEGVTEQSAPASDSVAEPSAPASEGVTELPALASDPVAEPSAPVSDLVAKSSLDFQVQARREYRTHVGVMSMKILAETKHILDTFFEHGFFQKVIGLIRVESVDNSRDEHLITAIQHVMSDDDKCTLSTELQNDPSKDPLTVYVEFMTKTCRSLQLLVHNMHLTAAVQPESGHGHA